MKKRGLMLAVGLVCLWLPAAMAEGLQFEVGAPISTLQVAKEGEETSPTGVSVLVSWTPPVIHYTWSSGAWTPQPCEAPITLTNQSLGVDVVVTIACNQDFWGGSAAEVTRATGLLGCQGQDCAVESGEETLAYPFTPPGDLRLTPAEMSAVESSPPSAVLTVSIESYPHDSTTP